MLLGCNNISFAVGFSRLLKTACFGLKIYIFFVVMAVLGDDLDRIA